MLTTTEGYPALNPSLCYFIFAIPTQTRIRTADHAKRGVQLQQRAIGRFSFLASRALSILLSLLPWPGKYVINRADCTQAQVGLGEVIWLFEASSLLTLTEV